MSPREIIERAAKDGVLLAVLPSGSISAMGDRSAIDHWLRAIRQSKAVIVLLLRPGADGWSAKDWRVFFDDRAGIAEFDGGLTGAHAEGCSFACCTAEWVNRSLARPPRGLCLGCDGGDHVNDPLLPFGIEHTGPASLHSRCWPAWYEGRKVEAIATLSSMGIPV